MTSPLWERAGSSTLDVLQETVWFLGTKCLSSHAMVVVAIEKPVAVTVESIFMIVGLVVATVGSPLYEALQSCL